MMSDFHVAGSPTATGASRAAETSKPRIPDPPHAPTAGTILLAFTSNLACWVITGAIAYVSPPLPASDDYTFLVIAFLPLEAFAIIYLILTASDKGWVSTTPITSAAIAGIGTTTAYVICWTTWKNFATFAFWVEAGVYLSLVFEIRFRVFQLAERKIGIVFNL
jgi:hypothetical protein